MMLDNKNAIIYGAGGSIGGAVAKSFAREGARVFLTGRTEQTLAAVAREITAAGGRADVAVVDAQDERAVEEHARAVVAEADSIDVSLNLTSRGDVQGKPLTEMSTEDFMRPVIGGVTSLFITARTAARQMTAQGSGVILTLNSGSAMGSPNMGGTATADGALDALMRNLATELGPHGIRALGVWIAGVPETLTAEKLGAVDSSLADPAAVRGVLDHLDSLRLLPASPRLGQVVDLLTFLASDRAGAITGTSVNATAMFTN
jgi:NAD(P)-dependent dehydrogenase (short-subunit alcohol dehydrogenase family)